MNRIFVDNNRGVVLLVRSVADQLVSIKVPFNGKLGLSIPLREKGEKKGERDREKKERAV